MLKAGLADKGAKAIVKVPCPSCHKNNQVIFTPEEGTLDEVFADEETFRYKIPVPRVSPPPSVSKTKSTARPEGGETVCVLKGTSGHGTTNGER